jgi:hypothetical protein
MISRMAVGALGFAHPFPYSHADALPESRLASHRSERHPKTAQTMTGCLGIGPA